MERKEPLANKKTGGSGKPESTAFCNHCGGVLRFFEDDISCLMCGRNVNHFCENCLNSRNLAKKSA